VYWQVALVFGLIALLGLVLRWTFGRDPALPSHRPRRRSLRRRRTGSAREPNRPDASPISPAAGAAALAPASSGAAESARPSSDARGSESGGTPNGTRDDYGLLAVAADVATADEAATLRRVLREAGIRNTSALAANGRHKVLVFGQDLMRARRVAGGAQGGTGGTQGAGSS
jgi:hypothetical protein